MINEVKIINYLRKNLTKQRFNHVLGMAEFARELALHHGLKGDKAKLAGLLHDLARNWNEKKLIEYSKNRFLRIPHKKFIMEFQPILLHSFVGVDLAKKIFHVKDKNILSAIAKHSFGAVQMSSFDKLIYVADLAAPDRTYRGVEFLRKIAYKNLDQAFIEGIKKKISHLLEVNEKIYPEAVRVWNFWVKQD